MSQSQPDGGDLSERPTPSLPEGRHVKTYAHTCTQSMPTWLHIHPIFGRYGECIEEQADTCVLTLHSGICAVYVHVCAHTNSMAHGSVVFNKAIAKLN